jgi:hypothetical protein
MRPLLVLALLSSLLGAAASPLRADWLVLIGGKRIATEGPWSLKGDLLTVHETSGRILTVATSTVDADACLKANGGALHVQVVPTAPAPGSPLTKPRIDPAPSGAPAPRNPATVPGRTALPDRLGAVAAGAPPAKPAAAAAGAATAGAPASGQPTPGAPAPGAPAPGAPAAGAPAAPTAPGAPVAAAAPKAKTPEERAAAQKLAAKQAQMKRDQRRQQIVAGCARMFVVDKAGFDRCVQTQTQAQAHAP